LPKFVLWIVVPILPYSFLTYSPYIPSRQLYMSSMVVVSVLSYLIRECRQPRIQLALVIAFIAYNISYMWIRNDPEFESRAAPANHWNAVGFDAVDVAGRPGPDDRGYGGAKDHRVAFRL